MGVLLAFAVGYVVGARAGKQGLDELKAALNELVASEEFDSLVVAARSHASHALREAAARLSSDPDQPLTVGDVVGRLRARLRPDDDVTSTAS